MSPSYFESDVDITYKGESRHAKIFMNNIAYIGPYRVYQSSYDQDEAGTVLTVNRDMAGTVISYIGYVLLMVGMIMSFFDKNGRLRGASFLCWSCSCPGYCVRKFLHVPV